MSRKKKFFEENSASEKNKIPATTRSTGYHRSGFVFQFRAPPASSMSPEFCLRRLENIFRLQSRNQKLRDSSRLRAFVVKPAPKSTTKARRISAAAVKARQFRSTVQRWLPRDRH